MSLRSVPAREPDSGQRGFSRRHLRCCGWVGYPPSSRSNGCRGGCSGLAIFVIPIGLSRRPWIESYTGSATASPRILCLIDRQVPRRFGSRRGASAGIRDCRSRSGSSALRSWRQTPSKAGTNPFVSAVGHTRASSRSMESSSGAPNGTDCFSVANKAAGAAIPSRRACGITMPQWSARAVRDEGKRPKSHRGSCRR